MVTDALKNYLNDHVPLRRLVRRVFMVELEIKRRFQVGQDQ